jgi:protein-S-isoprenylcysteine O-methyltransferase Ste14
LAIICLLLIVATLIWKQFIEVRLVAEERDLLRQLSDENYRPGWHKVVMVPRGKSAVDDALGEPPPYK